MQFCIGLRPLIGILPIGSLVLSIALSAQAEREQQMEMWTGMAESVDWTRVARPTWLRRCAFQVGTRAATESMSSCSLLLASL